MLAAAIAVGACLAASGSAGRARPSRIGTTLDRGGDVESSGAVRLRGGLGIADGAIPAGTSVFDANVPGVANLSPALRGALRRAATDAAGQVSFVVDSGWRSRTYQAMLRRQAVKRYGSEQEAARWVATPGTSAHVAGRAIDLGPPRAAAWLAAHGAAHGLCRVYANEPWHFELRPAAPRDGCPRLYADPTQDPRMDSEEQLAPQPARRD